MKHLVQIELDHEQWEALRKHHRSAQYGVAHAVTEHLRQFDTAESSDATQSPYEGLPLEEILQPALVTEGNLGKPYATNLPLRISWWSNLIIEGCIAARKRFEESGL